MKLKINFIYLIMTITLCACWKAPNESIPTIPIALKILNANENLTNEYIQDSILINSLSCISPNYRTYYGRAEKNLDSVYTYQFVFCCRVDTSLFIISHNTRENVLDTFALVLTDDCNDCEVVDVIKFTENVESEISFDGNKVAITLYE